MHMIVHVVLAAQSCSVHALACPPPLPKKVPLLTAFNSSIELQVDNFSALGSSFINEINFVIIIEKFSFKGY